MLIAFSGVGSGADLPLIDAHSQVDNGVDVNHAVWLMDEAGTAHAILSALRGGRKAAEIIAAAKRPKWNSWGIPGAASSFFGLGGAMVPGAQRKSWAEASPAGGGSRRPPAG